MKRTPREIGRLLAKPLGARGILVHGEDRGSVTDLANKIAAAIVPDPSDPFAVALLEADSLKGEPARLHDELFALSPLGGPKLVRLREAGDRQTAPIEAALAEPLPPGNVLLIEAGELAFRSSLRKLFEGQATLIAIGCDSAESGDVEAFIRDSIAEEGFRIAPDAVAALARRLGADRALLRRALELIILYKGDERDITEADIRAATADSEALGLEEVIDALLTGARGTIDRALTKALAAGTSPVAILRGALRSFQRIQMVSTLMEQGVSADEALSGLFPPLPYAARGMFLAACRSWTGQALFQVLRRLNEAEAQCKTTGLPEAVICAETLLRLCDLTGTSRAA